MRLPMLDLEREEGGRFDWGEMWQRSHLVLFLPHDGCETCAAAEQALERSAVEIAEDRGKPLVVRTDGTAASHLAGVRDGDGRLAAALGVRRGSIVAVDRYFEVLAVWDVHAGPADAVRAAVDRIDLAELECPECGVGTW